MLYTKFEHRPPVKFTPSPLPRQFTVLLQLAFQCPVSCMRRRQILELFGDRRSASDIFE